MRLVDPVGSERWLSFDALGRLLEVVSPAPDGSGTVLPQGATLTSYRYDGNSNIVGIDLHAKGLATQQRRFHYDSLSRLVRMYLPECGDGIRETRGGWRSGGAWRSVTTNGRTWSAAATAEA